MPGAPNDVVNQKPSTGPNIKTMKGVRTYVPKNNNDGLTSVPKPGDPNFIGPLNNIANPVNDKEIITVISPTGNIYTDGMIASTDQALNMAEDFLGPNYIELSPNGRFISADGKRQIRMTDSDLNGHRGGPAHLNFEEMTPHPRNPNKLVPNKDVHIILTDITPNKPK